MLRSPSKPFSSNPDLSTETDAFYNMSQRKRKQPDCELTENFNQFTDKMQKMIKDLSEDLYSKISRIDENINLMRSDLDTLSVTTKEIKGELASLRHEQANLRQKIHQIDNKQDSLQKDVLEIQNALDFNSDLNDKLGQRVEKLETECVKNNKTTSIISSLESKIEALEQHARSCNIEICGVPEKRNEDLMEIVANISKHINLSIQQSDILTIHRVPQAQTHANRPKNIIVKVSSRILRDNILSAFRKAKGVTTNDIGIPGTPKSVFMNEHLTLERKKLFRDCREAAKKENYQYVWIKHATILVRESNNHAAIAIRTQEDISKIKSGSSKKLSGIS